MKVKDILNTDATTLKSLTSEGLRSILNSLVSAANKRIRRIEATGKGKISIGLNIRRNKRGVVKPFTSKLAKSKFYKPYKDEDKLKKQEELRKEEYLNRISNVKTFLQSKGSSMKGVEEIEQKIITDLKIKNDYDKLSDKQKARFWDIYHMAQKRDKNLFDRRAGEKVYETKRAQSFDIMVKYRTKSGRILLRGTDTEEKIEDLIKDIIEHFGGIYKKQEKEREDDSALSAVKTSGKGGGLSSLGEKDTGGTLLYPRKK